MAKAKGSAPGKNTGFMSMFAAYRLLNEAYTRNPALLPVIGPMLTSLLKNQGAELPANAAQVLSTMPVDQPLSPETGQPIGTAQPGAPTSGTRSQAQTADRVLTEMPRIQKDVASLGNELGPVMGRWNEFETGKVGAGDPRFEKLRTDMQFIAAAAAKFHLNSVRAVQEFNQLASAGKMTPEVLSGYLDTVNEWAKTAQAQEQGFGEQGPKKQEQGGKPALPAGATVIPWDQVK
jgi:hypothetical protein